MRPVVYSLVVLLLVGLALTMVPAPVALACSSNSARHMLAPEAYTRVLYSLLHGVGAHLNQGLSTGLRPAWSDPEHVGALRRPSCLAGCPPIMHPFVRPPR